MAALTVDWRIEQGADWPGMAYYIHDAADNPQQLAAPMSAIGWIVYGGQRVFELSTSPTAGQGLIAFQGSVLVPSVTAAQNALWSFNNARYELYLTDPAAPPTDRTIKVGQGVVYLSRTLG